jgi:metallophosphoesterase (TIGR00282 family)
MIRILHVGDVVGSPGRRAFARVATRMREQGTVDMIVVNGENAAGGRGITPDLADELFAAGADVITLGDHTWDQKQIIGHLDREPRLVRPANFADACPGRGFVRVDTAAGPVSVLQVIGRVFMPPAACPFQAADRILNREGARGVVLVEIHAEATSEKIAFGRFLDGRVTSVVGTHTHVQTADETLLPKGTAYITDLGMTGPKDSVIGRSVEPVLQRFLTGMPAKFDVATDQAALEGVLLHIHPKSGRARKIVRVREMVE